MAASVRDNKDKNRFELDVGGDIAFANYRLTPSAVIITQPKRRAPSVAAVLGPSWSRARWT
jgi:hypothetical protein